MYAVIFEVFVKDKNKEVYLGIAESLKEQLIKVDGFISIERFESLVTKDKLLSLSFWESKEAIAVWKSNLDHLIAQKKGRLELFSDYRIRISKIEKDYTKESSNADY